MAVCLATLCYYCLLVFVQIVKLLCKSIVLWCELMMELGREGGRKQTNIIWAG